MPKLFHDDKLLRIDKFFCDKRVILENMDYRKVMDKFCDSDCLLLLDPPYFDSFNSFYFMYNGDYKTKNIVDNTEMYIDILTRLKGKSKIVMFIASNSIIDHVYKEYIKESNKKTYGLTGKKAIHNIITNF